MELAAGGLDLDLLFELGQLFAWVAVGSLNAAGGLDGHIAHGGDMLSGRIRASSEKRYEGSFGEHLGAAESIRKFDNFRICHFTGGREFGVGRSTVKFVSKNWAVLRVWTHPVIVPATVPAIDFEEPQNVFESAVSADRAVCSRAVSSFFRAHYASPRSYCSLQASAAASVSSSLTILCFWTRSGQPGTGHLQLPELDDLAVSADVLGNGALTKQTTPWRGQVGKGNLTVRCRLPPDSRGMGG